MVDPTLLTVTITGLFCAGFALAAYGMRVLDALGSSLAFVMALIITLSPGLTRLEGFRWLALLVLFVLVGFAVTKAFYERKKRQGVAEEHKGIRGWRNVVANGGVPSILAIMAIWVDPEIVALGFIAAVATAASDTFASELGVLSQRTWLITNPRKHVPPGTNGGVSWWGQFMALTGSTFASLVGVALLGAPWSLAWIPLLAGWAGCQVDSVLGALFEEGRGRVYGFLTKSDVNFLSILIASFSVLLIFVS